MSVLLPMAFGLVAIVFASPTWDDGFYYLRIARHLALGDGLTFDGMHATTGVHPLWVVLLVPIFRIWASASAALLAVGALQVLLWSSGVALLFHFTREKSGPWVAGVACILWSWFSWRSALSGLEFSLQTTLLIWAAGLLNRFSSGPQPGRSYLGLGLVLGLAVLARLDLALVVPFLAGFYLIRDRGLDPWMALQRTALLVAPAAVAVALVGGLNLVLVGHLQPVSSFIKEQWSRQLVASDPICQRYGVIACKALQLVAPMRFMNAPLDHPFALSLGIGTLLLPVSLAFAPLRRWLSNQVPGWVPIALAAVSTQACYAILFHGGLSFAPWYFAVTLYAVARLGGLLVQLAPSKLRWMAASLSILFVGVAMLIGLSHQLRHRRDPQRELADWVRVHLPATAVVGAWNAGALGYFSEHRVVALDGLVNSWDFALGGRRDLCGYWNREGVQYVADSFRDREALSAVPSLPTYASCAAALEPIWRDDSFGQPWELAVFRVP